MQGSKRNNNETGENFWFEYFTWNKNKIYLKRNYNYNFYI